MRGPRRVDEAQKDSQKPHESLEHPETKLKKKESSVLASRLLRKVEKKI